MKSDRKAELLAPAGSFETIRGAVNAGADAVYIGGQMFGARAYADNPDTQQLLSAIDYMHIRGKKLYLTVNTLVKNREFDELYRFLTPLYKEGLDAVIVQDLGVLSFIKAYFPGLDIHASTQMTLTGSVSAAWLKELGASRIVTARELSIEELAGIRDHVDIEVEAFVHGALCYCYSGRCLFSSMIGGRSGNRGRCAQPCRLPYTLYSDNGDKALRRESYLLSPKDMCTLELLPQILDAGVYSLKIEGRMKRPEYTAGVTSVYRKYLDQCLEGTFKGVSHEDHKRLYELFNRDGFNKGYYLQHNGRDMMALDNRKLTERDRIANNTLYDELHKAYLQEDSPVMVSGWGRFQKGKPACLSMEYSLCDEAESLTVTLSGDAVEAAKSQPVDRQRITKQLKKRSFGDLCIHELTLDADEDIFISVGQLNTLRREAAQSLYDTVLERFKRTEPIENHSSAAVQSSKSSACWSVAVMTLPQLQAVVCAQRQPDRIYVEWELYFSNPEGVDKVLSGYRGQRYLALPQIVRGNTTGLLKNGIDQVRHCFDGYLVRCIKAMVFMENTYPGCTMVLDEGLYVFNDRAQALYTSVPGVTEVTVSPELNRHELSEMDQSASEMVVYGRSVLMVSAQCPAKTANQCDHAFGWRSLRDRKGMEFPVHSMCSFCHSVIYNSVPLYLLDKMDLLENIGFCSFRLTFTDENQERTGQLVEAFIRSMYHHEVPAMDHNGTRGHFKRGVE